MQFNNSHKVVCFGEVLWDILPSGDVPGGAPMNVAYHLSKLNKNPALITRIGADQQGIRLKDVFSKLGVCTDYFQVDRMERTGRAIAKPNEYNEITYDIVKPSAWDFIDLDDEVEELVKNAEYFVFGSLAARNDISKKTLFKLLEIASVKVLDINLRTPHFDKHIIEELLYKADFLKLNIEELNLIFEWYADFPGTNDRIKFIKSKFNIRGIVVTMGSHGALLSNQSENIRCGGIKVKVTDTVGSGDAFLAGLLAGFMDKKTDKKAIKYANCLGALIATKRGACPEYEIEEVEYLMNDVK